MKNRKIYLHLTIAMLLGMSTMFISCSDNENLEDPVDLRYEVQDRYDIGAIDPDPIKFRVKSSKQWIVTSNNADWCEITPPDGEPNVAYDIEVNYKDNVHLDDRIDTLIIKSDYWIGEWVTVVQKGTAYLDVEGADALTFIEDGGDLSFAVKSNQDWTATIVEGGEWLTMNSGSSGSLDGEISLSVGANRGERRTTQIEIYDRHGVLARTVDVTQSGVTLDVMGSTNMRVFFDDTYISFDVESNAEWEIVNDSKDAWYSFSQMSYSGNGTVEVVLEKNPLTSVRTASFKLQTKAVEGTTPVVREIEIKQAYEPIPNHYEFDATEKPKWEFLGGNPDFNGDVVLKGGVRQMIYGVGVGTYSFKVKDMTDAAYVRIYFLTRDGEIEVRCHFFAEDFTTYFSTRPYTPINDDPRVNTVLDKKDDFVLGLELGDNGDGSMLITWMVDGVKICSQPANYGKFLLSTTQELDLLIDASPGDVTMDWWRFADLLKWD